MSQLGFTLLEILIIVVVLGVLTAIATPNFLSLMDNVRINQTVTEVRGTLQEGQRQAIRNSQPCVVSLSLSHKDDNESNPSPAPDSSLTTAQCPATSESEVRSGVDVATNISSTSTLGNVAVTFGIYGSAEFGVIGQIAGASTSTQDPSGKIVAYIPTRENVQKKCIAISNTLGLTRVGNYTGGVTPEEITTDGVCTALDWTTQ